MNNTNWQRVTIIFKNPTDYTCWSVDIDQDELNRLVEQHQNDGCSLLGSKEDILQELSASL